MALTGVKKHDDLADTVKPSGGILITMCVIQYVLMCCVAGAFSSMSQLYCYNAAIPTMSLGFHYFSDFEWQIILGTVKNEPELQRKTDHSSLVGNNYVVLSSRRTNSQAQNK